MISIQLMLELNHPENMTHPLLSKCLTVYYFENKSCEMCVFSIEILMSNSKSIYFF